MAEPGLNPILLITNPVLPQWSYCPWPRATQPYSPFVSVHLQDSWGQWQTPVKTLLEKRKGVWGGSRVKGSWKPFQIQLLCYGLKSLGMCKSLKTTLPKAPLVFSSLTIKDDPKMQDNPLGTQAGEGFPSRKRPACSWEYPGLMGCWLAPRLDGIEFFSGVQGFPAQEFNLCNLCCGAASEPNLFFAPELNKQRRWHWKPPLCLGFLLSESSSP